MFRDSLESELVGLAININPSIPSPHPMGRDGAGPREVMSCILLCQSCSVSVAL